MNLSLSLPEYPGTSSPFASVFICWGNKGKTLFNSQSQVGNMFLPFSLFKRDFFFLKFKEGICSSPKIPKDFRNEGGEKICPYCTEGFFPLSIPKAGDKIQQLLLQNRNADCQQSTIFSSSIRRLQGTA